MEFFSFPLFCLVILHCPCSRPSFLALFRLVAASTALLAIYSRPKSRDEGGRARDEGEKATKRNAAARGGVPLSCLLCRLIFFYSFSLFPTQKQRFAAVIMRIRDPKTTALIFASGKMVRLFCCVCVERERERK